MFVVDDSYLFFMYEPRKEGGNLNPSLVISQNSVNIALIIFVSLFLVLLSYK